MIPSSLCEFPTTDPTSVYRFRDGLYAADMLAVGVVHLDLFSHLTTTPSSLEGVCAHYGTHQRPTDVMLTLFVAMGLLRKEGTNYVPTATAKEHLAAGSPWNLAPYYASLKDRPVTLDLLKVLRTGKPANWGGYQTTGDWHKSMEDEAFAKQFTAAMDCRGVYLGASAAASVDLTGVSRLLDVGGGSGIYACCLAARNPSLHATVLDKAPVDQIAARNIEARGLADRVNVTACDMLKERWPSGHDAHLISNVLHDWDEPIVLQLLGSSAEALPNNGLLIIHDAFLNEDKSGPLPVAAYSVLLMHATEGRCYGVGEMRGWLTELGFTDIHFQPTAADRGVMTARKKV